MDKDKTTGSIRKLKKPVIKKAVEEFVESVMEPPTVIKVEKSVGPILYCCMFCGKNNKQVPVCRFCSRCEHCAPPEMHHHCWRDVIVNYNYIDPLEEIDTKYKRFIFLEINFGLDFIPTDTQMDELKSDIFSTLVMWRRRNK